MFPPRVSEFAPPLVLLSGFGLIIWGAYHNWSVLLLKALVFAVLGLAFSLKAVVDFNKSRKDNHKDW